MIKRNIIWYKVKNSMYQRIEYHDETMGTLSLFFEDGLGFQTYIDFLKDEQDDKFYGNISTMKKKGKIVIINIHEEIFPDMPAFSTTIENMITIVEEYRRLYRLGVDVIEISFDDDTPTIRGDWNH